MNLKSHRKIRLLHICFGERKKKKTTELLLSLLWIFKFLIFFFIRHYRLWIWNFIILAYKLNERLILKDTVFLFNFIYKCFVIYVLYKYMFVLQKQNDGEKKKTLAESRSYESMHYSLRIMQASYISFYFGGVSQKVIRHHFGKVTWGSNNEAALTSRSHCALNYLSYSDLARDRFLITQCVQNNRILINLTQKTLDYIWGVN